jgi:ferredoxin
MATIFYFTSTGNSLYAARRIADEIDAKVLPMREEYSVCGDDVVGLVFPNYYWSVPRIVRRFISKLRLSNRSAYVFAVITCGDPRVGVTGMLDKLLKAKGIDLAYAERLITVSNYLPKHDSNASEHLQKKSESKLNEIIRRIKGRETKPAHSAWSVLSSAIAFKFCPGVDSDRDFTVSGACGGCGVCARVCPAGNIVMEGRRPSFRHSCEHCLGCLHNCPAEAIEWNHKTEGKKRYRHPSITLEDLCVR